MRRKHIGNLNFNWLFFLSAMLLSILPAAAAGAKWAHAESDLAADPKIQWGRLENGLRYAVRPHDEPPGRVSLRLLVEVGSVMEEENERGLAHFIEHMAFNGTKHFEAGEMVKYFQRLGMAFGADTNAHTSFFETGYQVDLPSNNDEMVEKGLLLLRDYADRMILAEEQIEKERGVILSEQRTRNTVQYRTFKARMDFLLPQSRLSQRHPIGTEEVIRNAPRETFVSFYNKWYIPSRTVVVVVGDVAPQKLIQLIEQHFSSMTPSQKPPRAPELGDVAPQGLNAVAHREEEAAAVTVALHTLHPYQAGSDDRQHRVARLRRAAAHRIISRRLEVLARQGGAAFSEGHGYAYDWLRFVTIAALEMKTDPDTWEETLKVAETELRRALTHGFTTSEINQATSELLTHFRQAAKAASTMQSGEMADGIVRAISQDEVYTTPELDLEIALQALEHLTPEAALDALKKTWNANDSRYVFVSGNVHIEDGKAKLSAVYQKNRENEVAPPVEAETQQFAYTDFGTKGKVALKHEVEGLGITQLQFENNVHVNLKPTRFEANTVRVAVRFGGGKLAAPLDKPGVIPLANQAFVQGGLGKHSFTEIKKLVADKSVDINFTVDNGAFVLYGQASTQDLPDQLALLAAYLVDPGYRDDALRVARKQLADKYRVLKHTPYGVFEDRVMRFIASGDVRFGYPPREDVLNLTMDDLKDWLKEPLKNGMLEVSLAGDMDVARTIDALERTFGALPERRATKPSFDHARDVDFPVQAEVKTLQYETAQPKALVTVFWPTADIWNISRTRRLNILSRILSDRVRIQIREDIGETYSPTVFSHQSDVFQDYGYLAVLIICDPKQADAIADVVQQIGAELHREGATEDEMTRAVQPVIAGLDEQLRRNEYWLHTVLMGATEHPERFDWARSIRNEYANIQRADVNETAADYLAPEAAVTVLVRPVKTQAEEGNGAAGQP